jgi:hypothetical protein
MSKVRPFYFRDLVIEQEAIEGISCQPFLMDSGSVKKRLAELDKEIESMQQSLDFREWFSLFSKFYQYSFRNTLLILWQYPRATFVAGYQQWINRWNRYVRKGEKGIRILAPMIKKETSTEIDPDTSIEIKRESSRIMGFRIVCVFDVAQTEQIEGKPIKFDESIIHTKIVPTTKEIESYYQLFLDYLQSKQIQVIFKPRGEMGLAKGSTDGVIISIRDDLSTTEALFVLMHEYAHYVLHYERIFETVPILDPTTGQPEIDPKTGISKVKQVSRVVRITDYNREVKELQAEAVIYVVGDALNLFTGENIIFRDEAVRYMASWKKQAKLIDSLQNVHGISREILQLLYKPPVPISEAAL